MKKYLLTLLTLFVILAPNVKADEKVIATCDYSDDIPTYFSRFGKDFIVSKANELYEKYKTNYENDYPFYTINLSSFSNGSLKYFAINLNYSDSFKIYWFYSTISNVGKIYHYGWNQSSGTVQSYNTIRYVYKILDNDELELLDGVGISLSSNSDFLTYDTSQKCSIKLPLFSNINPGFVMNFDIFSEVRLQDKPGSTTYTVLNKTTSDYVFKDYSQFLDDVNSPSDNFTTVNLDNYEYVILNLKDYNQDKAFNTNLKVKGMIGITPIYNFGQTETDVITDRCNLSYKDYTDYRFSILKQDLQNNAIYIVKSCESGSSFKFDNTIFDVSYVTADNVDDPVVTIGGKDYHTIPFKNLTNSANKNEENNFVPGESGFSLTDVVSNISKYVSSFWDSIVNFMGLVTKFFNTLPIEIKGVAITTFSMACMIALIKFLKS
ncbi:MAG: hypothetical protein PUD25_02440 [Bacilli bacterium]|nr:hypothetical protein [Bacilli bacterium]